MANVFYEKTTEDDRYEWRSSVTTRYAFAAIQQMIAEEREATIGRAISGKPSAAASHAGAVVKLGELLAMLESER